MLKRQKIQRQGWEFPQTSQPVLHHRGVVLHDPRWMANYPGPSLRAVIVDLDEPISWGDS